MQFMQKNAYWVTNRACGPMPYNQVRRTINQTLLAMKLTFLFMTLLCLNVHAKSIAQTITFSGKNVPLKTVFEAIRQQTGYVFFSKQGAMENTHAVTISVKGISLQKFLDSLLRDQPITYSISLKTIILSEKEAASRNMSTFNLEASPPPPFKTFLGQVLDEKGAPLEGVIVTVKGTTRRTITKADGTFSIDINLKEVLTFSSVGFEVKELTITPALNIYPVQIQLVATFAEMSNVGVISTGYQVVRKENSTGATSTVSSKELEKRYTPNIIDNLEGRIPGLVNYKGVTTIRGISSLSATTSVLIVVDGLPFESPVANLNPYDIESVTVLKDAAATAIYGARASNGIIVITTKKAKSKGTSVSFSSDITRTDKVDNSYGFMTPAQQVDIESDFFNYNYVTAPGAASNISAAKTSITNGSPITPVQYAWYQYAQNLITKSDLESQLTGFKQNDFRKQYRKYALLNQLLQQYDLAVRTNGNKFQSSLVLNFKTDNSGIIHAYNRQFNLFYKGTYQVASWMDINFGVNTILSNIKASNSSFATSSSYISPYIPLVNADGTHNYYTTADYNSYNTLTDVTPQLHSMKVNHLDELAMDAQKTRTNNSRLYVNVPMKILPGLTINPQFQYEYNTSTVSAYSEAESFIMRYLKNIYTSRTGTAPNYAYTYLLPTSGGKLATTQIQGNYWTARGQMDYNREFGKHAISVIAGTEFRQTHSNGTKSLLLGYDEQLQSQSSSSVNFVALNAVTSTTLFKPTLNPSSIYATYITNAIGLIPDTTHRLNSGYANASYTYDNRYNAFGSFRKDYADVFGLDPKFRGKPLWSAGLGWNIHRENFMAQYAWVNFLKLRTTYGITGNINNGATSFLTANSSYVNAATGLPVSIVQSAANPELRWERTATTNVGIDFTLFRNRLSGTFDWYHKKGTDLFASRRIDPSEGFTSQIINNASMQNDGVELSLQYSWLQPKSRSGLQWSTMLVMTHNKNKVTYVDEVSATPLALAQGGFKVGYPVNALYSFQYKGINSVGQPQWAKADGTLSTVALTGSDMNAMVYSGNTTPVNSIALTNDLHFKGFSLNVLTVYYGGHYMRARQPADFLTVGYASLPSYVLDSWTTGKTNSFIPGIGQYAPPASPPSQYLTYSDAFVHPADFIKIRNVTLGYQLPERWAGKVYAKNIRLRFQLNNPHALWKKNKVDVDPETGGAALPTSYVLGINLNL